MTLAAGSRLGAYEILGPLGAGGMGEVYRARDGKLGRDVAIKVLPAAFAADADRLARFRREAKVLASLNHPHIAAIYGVEEADGIEALVLELVEGETLAERLAAGPLPLEEALDIARQAAEALEAAHERGIVHRDFKPANIKLTPGGQVKVLDFGLAKALAADVSSPDITTSPTLTAAATQAGVALGTAAYMAPEQARGKAVDRRADVWAFGVVLYEMLTGRHAFAGDTVSDTLASVLKTDPDLTALPEMTPAAIRRLLRRCLQKDPSRRLRDIGDARLELEERVEGTAADSGLTAAVPRTSRRLLLPGLVLGLAVGAASAWLIVTRFGPRQSRAPMRFVTVTNFSGVEAQPSLSPDGRSV
ncbi:MAG TPA: serine/threonine-protein kinase, partial [Thermoanaerobaculia bacterium]|nr:serine/threonine-protein kinase [Thermoanaerobaculia bacterium]